MPETMSGDANRRGSSPGEESFGSENAADWVNPFIDTANRRYFFFSSACRPFGMINLSPDTVPAGAWQSGYRFHEPHICWFSHVHAWQLAGIAVLPTTGEMTGHRGVEHYRSTFRHENEEAQPGYHRVFLDTYGITAELTATVRVGMHRYTFPYRESSVSQEARHSQEAAARGADSTGQQWPDIAHLLFDLGAEIGPVTISDCCVQAVSPTVLCGYVENEATRRRPKNTRIYFVIELDKPFELFAGFCDGRIIEPRLCPPVAAAPMAGAPRKRPAHEPQAGEELVPTIDGRDTGCYLKYSVADMWCREAGEGAVVDEDGAGTHSTSGERYAAQLQMKVAISYCGVAEAGKNLEAELPHWDFDAVRRDARDEWNRRLGVVSVEGASEAKRIKLYTDLYHSLLGRRRVSDYHGTYCDMTGPQPVVRQIPCDERGRPRYEHHNSDSFWGAQWTLNTLWPLICPDIVVNFCNMFVDYYHNGGLIPRGPSGGNYTFVMIAPTSTPFVVSAWQKGIREFDVSAAYEGLRRNHLPGGLMSRAGYEHHSAVGGGAEHYIDLGYVPEGLEADAIHLDSASMTLEYAFCDWCLAQLAAALGREGDYEQFLARAGNYRNIWDPQSGFFRPRHGDGSWREPFDPWEQHGFCEANGYHYLWWVPHDVPGLIELMGGPETFVRRLDEQFRLAEPQRFIAPHGRHEENVMDYGNQPSTHLAHLFAWAGRPALTQKWVRAVYNAAKSDISPDGGYGGDEDQGLMGSLNALFAIGLFQMRAGCDADPIYELATPLFRRIRIRLDPRWYEAGELCIEADRDPADAPYIRAAYLNGQPLERPWIRHSEIASGARVSLELSDDPDQRWGSGGMR